MCTNQQLPNFNVQAFPTFDASTSLPVQAFQLQILPDGDVLVVGLERGHPPRPQRQRRADLHVCVAARMPGIAVRHEPRPGRQLLLDRRLDLGRHLEGRHRLAATCCRQINTHSGSLFGLSVDDQIEVAAPAPP